MPKTTTVPLLEPIQGHPTETWPDGKIAALVMREPNASEYFAHGEPQILARNPDGTLYTVENDVAVQAYMAACLVEPKDPLLLKQLGLADAIKAKTAMLDFFISAREAGAPKKDSSSTAQPGTSAKGS